MRTHTTLLATLLSLASIAQSMFSDEFNDPAMDPRWIRINPNVDSDTILTGSELLLRASPQNGGSDYFTPTNYDAVRVLQPVCGNWAVEAQLHVGMTGNFQGAGFLLIPGEATDTIESHRVMERRYNEQCQTPATHGFWLVDTMLCDIGAQDSVMRMRLARDGDTLSGSVSFDGINWQGPRSVISNQDFRYVGISSMRYNYGGGASLYSNAYYDYFRFLYVDTMHIESLEGPLIGVGHALHLSVVTVSNGTYAWYGPNGTLLSDSATMVIDSVAETDAGWYHLVVSRLDCDFLTDSFLLDVSTAIGEVDLEPTRITIAPNPGKDLITISWSDKMSSHGVLLLRDAMGRVVLRKSLNGDQKVTLSVAALPSGAYFVGMQGEQRGSHGRFVKE